LWDFGRGRHCGRFGGVNGGPHNASAALRNNVAQLGRVSGASVDALCPASQQLFHECSTKSTVRTGHHGNGTFDPHGCVLSRIASRPLPTRPTNDRAKRQDRQFCILSAPKKERGYTPFSLPTSFKAASRATSPPSAFPFSP